MKDSSKIAVLFTVSIIIAATFAFLGSLMDYPDSIIVWISGVFFALILSLVLFFNTGRPDY